ncbi:MAG: amino acid racemase [Ferruginibacter sp.]|nr:amino acid racemase [Ferruginibacter sp.]
MNDLTGTDSVIGIAGGMGPEAGGILFNKILSHTKASKDQEHLSVMLMSLPKYIVDRTLFLQGAESVNPGINIAKMILMLESAGATIVGIPCNTSHVPEIYNVILQQLDLMNSKAKLVNMPFETCKAIKKKYPNITKVGLMASNGTYRSDLYKDLFKQFGYDIILPEAEFQNKVIHSIIYNPIYGIKANAGKVSAEVCMWIEQSLEFFRSRGAECIVLGCTEFSSVIEPGSVPDIFIVDSTECLAVALVNEARKQQTRIRSEQISTTPI